MSIPVDRFLVKHWVRTHAPNVNAFFEGRTIIKKDFRMFYVKVHDSIHYNAVLNNNYDIYDEYIQTAKQEEHSVEIFTKLKTEWDMAKFDKIKVVVEGEDLCIHDGVHRLALYVHFTGVKSVPCSLLDIDYPPDSGIAVGNALKSTTVEQHYNGWSNKRAPYGYHSFSLFNLSFIGQRNPVARLDIMRQHYSFKDRYVMDIGCNSGGMLFHLLEIRKGRGVDFDRVCINAANKIKESLLIYDHLEFMTRDLDREQIDDLFEGERPDVIFLLSLGSWIKSWRTVYTKALAVADTLFLETNNTTEGLPQLDFFRTAGCNILTVSERSLDDCTNNHGSTTYMITKAGGNRVRN